MDNPLDNPAFQNVIEKVKAGYFFFEDKYYALLDRINKYVPIYKVIDPIDKVVPSFILFIALVALIIIIFLFLSFASLGLVATLQVVDNKDNTLQGVAIELVMEGQTYSLTTDEWGEAKIELTKEEAEADGSFSKEGFADLERRLVLTANEKTSVTMQPSGTIIFDPDEAEKMVRVYDRTTNGLITQEVRLTFECSGGVSPPPEQIGSTGEFTVMQPSNCLTLIATAESDGYEKKSKTLSSKVSYIILSPNSFETTGRINVIVRDTLGTPEPNAVVRVIDEIRNLEVGSSSTTLSGSTLLQTIQPGTYTVSATSTDGRTGRETGVGVSAGETAHVTIELPSADQADIKKIYLKLVELGTTKPVSEAQAMIYEDDLLVDSTTSNAQGIVEKQMNDTGSNYIVVITHPDFVTHIEPNVPLKELSDTNPITIGLTRADDQPPDATSGKIVATVVDEELEPVKDALVSVYDSRYPEIPFKSPPGSTIADGTYTFTNLGPGTYIAKARNEGGSAEGASEPGSLKAGETLQLTVILVLGAGTVEATVYDAASAAKDQITNALVEIIQDGNISNILATCTTDSSGKCQSDPIPADKFVNVRASAQGFITNSSASTIDIVNRKTAKASIGLMPDDTIIPGCPPNCPPGCPPDCPPGCPPNCPPPYGLIDVDFVKFCQNRACTEHATKIQSDPAGTLTYYAMFTIDLKNEVTYLDTMQHVRVGLDSQLSLPSTGYGLKITGASGPYYTAAPLSLCWNNDEDNPFFPEPTDCAAGVDSKQVNLYYPGFEGPQQIPFVVQFKVEPALQDGKELEMHYMAKSNVPDGEAFTEKKVLRFKINEVFCADEDFSWGFLLTKPDGSTLVPETEPGSINELVMNQAYKLSYNIYNCGRNYSQASVVGENLDPNALSFTPMEPYDFGPIALKGPVGFPSNTEISQEFDFYTVSEADLTELELALGTESSSSIQGIGFSVAGGGTLKVIYAPSALRPNIVNQSLIGTVADEASGTPIESAFVKLAISDGREMNTTTNSSGIFSITIADPLEATLVATLSVRSAGYSNFEAQIPISDTDIPGSNPDLECITISKGNSSDVNINFVKDVSTSDTFTVKNGCNSAVVIKLESELKVDPKTEFVLNAGGGGTRQATVYAETSENSPYPIYMGEYGVMVMARFSEDDPLAGFAGPIQVARIYVRDPSSAFRLADPARPSDPNAMKSAFNITGDPDNGLIINKKYVYFEDVRMPRLEKVYGFMPVEEAFSLVFTPPSQPGVEVEKQMVFDLFTDYFSDDGKQIIEFVDNAGYVFVEWIDFYMSDGNHAGFDRHRVWAQTHRDVWSNITGQLPYTPVSNTKRLPEPVKPVVDNFGWVDTDVYYPKGSQYDDQLTTGPVWQGQHNVCNENLSGFDVEFGACSVNDYFNGSSIVPYKVGNVANKIALEVEGTATKLSAARWKYISTDKDHNGLIDFSVRNNTLMGEAYALLEVEDTTSTYFEPGTGGGITVDYIMSKRGVLIKENTSTLLNATTTVDVNKVLGISVGGTKGIYGSPAAACSALSSSVAKELTLVEFTSNENSPEFQMPPGKGIPNISFYTCSGTSLSKPSTFDVEVAGALDTLYFVYPEGHEKEGQGSPTVASAMLFENNSGDVLIVDTVAINYLTRESETIVLGTGSVDIPLGESYVEVPLEQDQALPTDPRGSYVEIQYVVEDTTPEGIVYFSDTRSSISPDPYSAGAHIIASTTSPEAESVTQTERFHVRLIGQAQAQCFGTGGVRGSTGPGSKPRVLLNWDWSAITPETCDSTNFDFVYCDPTQFTVSLVKRLEDMRRLSEADLSGNLVKLSGMREFYVYLIEDAYTDDFRNDFVEFYANKLFEDDLTNPEHPWRNYILDAEKFVFETGSDSKAVEAGLYEVFIQLDFDEDQFDFFYIEGEGDSAVVNLLANIKVHMSKVADPVIKSPFYYLPFNGSLGFENGEYSRDGYGLVFDNSTEPLAIVSDIGGTFYSTDMAAASTGRKLVGTYMESDFDAVNITNRGMVMQVAQDHGQINLAPSIATPVLLEIVPEQGKVEAYYYLRDQDEIAISAASFMNLWNGSGSTMKNEGGACIDYYGNKLQYRVQDRIPAGTCADDVVGSYGFNYEPVQGDGKLYLESVFYVPEGIIAHLRKSCDNASNFYAPGPSGTQTTDTPTTPVSLSIPSSKTRVATMEDVINLVEREYVCISSDDDYFSFWWNPQKVLQDLGSIKTSIHPGWDSELACEVVPG